MKHKPANKLKEKKQQNTNKPSYYIGINHFEHASFLTNFLYIFVTKTVNVYRHERLPNPIIVLEGFLRDNFTDLSLCQDKQQLSPVTCKLIPSVFTVNAEDALIFCLRTMMSYVWYLLIYISMQLKVNQSFQILEYKVHLSLFRTVGCSSDLIEENYVWQRLLPLEGTLASFNLYEDNYFVRFIFFAFQRMLQTLQM